MTERTATRAAAREASGALRPAMPPRRSGRAAGAPFTFRGHRLSSLYRAPTAPENPFIFLKILKSSASWLAPESEYLEKDESLEAALR